MTGDTLILEEMTQFYPVIEIKIKECKGGCENHYLLLCAGKSACRSVLLIDLTPSAFQIFPLINLYSSTYYS